MFSRKKRSSQSTDSQPELRISDEVRQFIGPAGVKGAEDAWKRLESEPGFVRCANCGSDMSWDPSDPGELILRVSGNQAIINYCHSRCGTSQIVEADGPLATEAGTDIAFQTFSRPEAGIAGLYWETPDKGLVIGDKSFEDGEAFVWQQRGASSLETFEALLMAEREDFPLLTEAFARFVPGSGLEILAPESVGSDPSLVVQFNEGESFEDPWLECASKAGEIRIALLTSVFRQAALEGKITEDNGGQVALPEGAVVGGRMPFSAI